MKGDMKEFSEHMINNKPMMGGNEEDIIAVFDEAIQLLTKESENKIRANSIAQNPIYLQSQQDIDFVSNRKSKDGFTITQTIKHILKSKNYIPKQGSGVIADVDFLQSEKDGIVDLKDKYFNEVSELNRQASTLEDRYKIDTINQKIKKLSDVAKAYKEYIREYHDEIVKNLLSTEK